MSGAIDTPATGRIYTVGHSTRTLDELTSLLEQFGVQLLADTRSIPMSRHNPQFNSSILQLFLEARGCEYQHHPLLGGRRTPHADSINQAWRQPSFRAYADYMSSEDFRRGIDRLEQVAKQKITAVMCAELAWWRCHRRLIADQLRADGFEVLHVLRPGHPPCPHRPSPGMNIVDGHIVYQPAQLELPL